MRAFLALDGRVHRNAEGPKANVHGRLLRGSGRRGEGKPRERGNRSAETSEQSKPQMPLLTNTRCEADVYPAQSREKKPGKAREIHAPQTRDFLGEGVAGNGFCKFLLLISTSQTKSEETFPSY